MAPRTNRQVANQAPVETVEAVEVKWLSHTELESYASMARKEDLSLDNLYACFDQDEAGYNLDGARVNAKVLTAMYYSIGRRNEMHSRMVRAKAETKRQGTN